MKCKSFSFQMMKIALSTEIPCDTFKLKQYSSEWHVCYEASDEQTVYKSLSNAMKHEDPLSPSSLLGKSIKYGLFRCFLFFLVWYFLRKLDVQCPILLAPIVEVKFSYFSLIYRWLHINGVLGTLKKTNE